MGLPGAFGELLIDLEDDRAARALVIGMLRQCSGMYLEVGRYSDTLALKPDAIATPARADNTNWICVTSNQ